LSGYGIKLTNYVKSKELFSRSALLVSLFPKF